MNEEREGQAGPVLKVTIGFGPCHVLAIENILSIFQTLFK
jgi:hypothetical protein